MGSNRASRLLHYDGALHLGMDRAKVGVRPRLGERKRELLIRIQRLGLDRLVVADYGVGDVVAVGPGHGSSHWDGQSCRAKAEVVNFDLGRRRSRRSGKSRLSEEH